MYACPCNALTEGDVRKAAAGGASSWEEILTACGGEPCCASCLDDVEALAAEVRRKARRETP